MSTFAKKVTSAVAGLAVVFSMVSPIAGVSAAYTGVDAANKLATLGVIVDQSANPADYRLGDNLPRKEAVKVMMNLSSIAVVDACEGDFSDLTSADWACKYAETALANGMVAANPTFGPDRLLSNIEGLKMVFQGRDLERNDNADWRAGYVDAAVEMGIAQNFTDYDTAVTRGQFFIWAANAIDAEVTTEEPGDILCELLGDCEEPTDPTDPTDPTTPVVTDGDLEVSVSPSTPESTTIPGGVNGLAVAAFDFTAGKSDVTVNQISVKRTGLSDAKTLDSLAIFTKEGRVSNAKSDNQDNDTTAQINLDNGGVVIEAGETETFVVVVDVNPVADTESDEFALEVVAVSSNASDVDGLGAKGNTMRVGSVDAPTLTFSNGGSVSNPNLGEKAADIFEFEIDGDNNEDVVLKSITFEGSSDAEDDLENFELVMGNKVVATTAKMKGDYLTFDLGDGLTIEEDKNEDFTVRADVVDGASDNISFDIDANLDVTANSTKFGFGAAVNIATFNPPAITIQAGELTFVELKSDIDEIREDKDNVVLGAFNIVNLSGNQLELQEFTTLISVNAGTSYIDVDNSGTNNAGDLIAYPVNLFDEVELYNEETGSSYTLTNQSGAALAAQAFGDDKVDSVIPTGTSKWIVRADTAEHIGNFDSAKINVSVDVDGAVKVVELTDDEEVKDKTPSNLSFDSIDGSESGAKVNLLPLANTDVVRGAKDVLALEFEVEAEEVSSVVVEELTVYVESSTGATTAAATKQQISEVTLYKDSVSAANQLDSDTLTNAGQVTFDKMGDISIAANGTQKFVVTIDVVDGNDPVSYGFTTSLSSIKIEDDESDDITVNTTSIVSARKVTVNDSGSIVTLALDSANEDNEFDKLALAGNSVKIASFDVRADNEEVDVETATFTFSGANTFATGSLKNTLINASLLLDGVVVATNANADISHASGSSTGTILFEDITDLIIPESTTELVLQLNTANIGEDKVGVAQTGLYITDVVLSDAEGVDSGEDAPIKSLNGISSKTVDVVTAVVTPSATDTFGTDDKIGSLRLVVDGGSNTDAAGDAVQANLTALSFEVTSFTGTGTITVLNGNGDTVGTSASITSNSGAVVVTLGAADSIGNDDETYEIQTTVEGIIKLNRDGVRYTVNTEPTVFSTKLENTLNLGEYSESN